MKESTHLIHVNVRSIRRCRNLAVGGPSDCFQPSFLNRYRDNALPPTPIFFTSFALDRQLRLERQKTAALTKECKRLKEVWVNSISAAEVEEECIINKMMKRLNQLKCEKEKLAVEVEVEEELLINNMSKRYRERENQLQEEVETLRQRVFELEEQARVNAESRHAAVGNNSSEGERGEGGEGVA